MLKIKEQRKQAERPEGGLALRVTHRAEHKKGKKTIGPCYNIKCGCCGEKVTIYYDSEDRSLEINGVNGSLENWREILLPLLYIEHKDGELVDVSPKALKAREILDELREKYQQKSPPFAHS